MIMHYYYHPYRPHSLSTINTFNDNSLTAAAPTTAAPTTAAPSNCAAMATNPTWYQDRYCDDVFNTPECNYDGGDCCVKKTDAWHNYCQV